MANEGAYRKYMIEKRSKNNQGTKIEYFSLLDSFSGGNNSYETISEIDFANLSDVDFIQRRDDFFLYLNISNNITPSLISSSTGVNLIACPLIPVTTTTTTTSTTTTTTTVAPTPPPNESAPTTTTTTTTVAPQKLGGNIVFVNDTGLSITVNRLRLIGNNNITNVSSTQNIVITGSQQETFLFSDAIIPDNLRFNAGDILGIEFELAGDMSDIDLSPSLVVSGLSSVGIPTIPTPFLVTTNINNTLTYITGVIPLDSDQTLSIDVNIIGTFSLNSAFNGNLEQ